jgi:hypothetical protein
MLSLIHPAPWARCSRQFGRASAPMMPQRVHTMCGPRSCLIFFGEVINSAQNPSLDEITISLIKATISR